MPNMDLRYSHKAELWHSLLAAMVAVFTQQQRLPINVFHHKEHFCQT